jgi:hypothetical protein
MSTYSRSEIGRRITCNPEGVPPAPVNEGALHGFFDDQATRSLLGLVDGDVLLSSGTYGLKEPGQRPIQLSTLREDLHDRRLLPFVPKNFSFESPLDLHEQNHQWLVHANSLHDLKEELNRARAGALAVASDVPLSLPSYARELVPKLLYQERETRSFQYQFQPFFSPSAYRARYARIYRVIALLDAYSNAGHRILSDRADWKLGEPIRIIFDQIHVTSEDLELARAYNYLGVPVLGMPSIEPREHYDMENARDALLGKRQGKATPLISFDPSPEYLEGTNDDALDYCLINPSYDASVFNSDGTRKTAAQRRDDREQAEDEEWSGSLNQMMRDPAGAPASGDARTADRASSPITREPSALGVTLGEAAGTLPSPLLPHTPSAESSSPSVPPSAFSSASSSNTPHSSGRGSSSRRRRDRGASSRSWGWSNATSSRRYEPYEAQGRPHGPPFQHGTVTGTPRQEWQVQQSLHPSAASTSLQRHGPGRSPSMPMLRQGAAYATPPAPTAATP